MPFTSVQSDFAKALLLPSNRRLGATITSALAIFAASSFVEARPTITALPSPNVDPTSAVGVSADGGSVLGIESGPLGEFAIVWEFGRCPQIIEPLLGSTPVALSDDGQAVLMRVGSPSAPGTQGAVIHRGDSGWGLDAQVVMLSLGPAARATVTDISTDGTYVSGTLHGPGLGEYGQNIPLENQAARWVSGTLEQLTMAPACPPVDSPFANTFEISGSGSSVSDNGRVAGSWSGFDSEERPGAGVKGLDRGFLPCPGLNAALYISCGNLRTVWQW